MQNIFKPQLRTKNFSAVDLKAANAGIGEFPARAIVRLGSRTSTQEAFPKSFGKRRIIEVNTVQSIENSRNKLLMKDCFAKLEIPQSRWFLQDDRRNVGIALLDRNVNEQIEISELPYPILAKKICGFKGHGMVKIDNVEQMTEFLSKRLPDYYWEQYFNGSAEYRLHVTEDGCFMAWRKLRKADTPDDRRWYFNSDHCNWVGEDHELFNKPSNWDEMIAASVNALKSVGLDIGSIDLRCQTPKIKNPAFIVVEVNSAPSLGIKGLEMYRTEIAKIITKKIENGG